MKGHGASRAQHSDELALERARGGRVRAANAPERKAGLRLDHRSSARLVEAAERLGEMLRSDNLESAM